jgi:hypothetical protein
MCVEKLWSTENVIIDEVQKLYVSCIVGTNLKFFINLNSLLQIHCYNCNDESNQNNKVKDKI